ncbi:hypothetical protein GNI_176450 [Gregarina niphandrodes]|uniref:Uncharacterized protein n=1 Tax=Gregarina niphandrodes TaxID=110365 RepID=A0A023AX72_GRENI|nr:hypothetical protein GNI_176450 [Gregarina niphandrodes]EZG43331.1 hypothetical protein GNI_176450 [Gregarina niphandrodes]|eukprot:XP_011133413.1 hypothetical protein GNI_176450 [Gregarina niphandrodes]
MDLELEYGHYWVAYVTPLVGALTEVILAPSQTLELRGRAEDVLFAMLTRLSTRVMTPGCWRHLMGLMIGLFEALLSRAILPTRQNLIPLEAWLGRYFNYAKQPVGERALEEVSSSWLGKTVLVTFRNLCALTFASPYAGERDEYLTVLLYCIGIYYTQAQETMARLGDDMLKHLGTFAKQFTHTQWDIFVQFVTYVLGGTEPIELLDTEQPGDSLPQLPIDFNIVMAKSILQLLLISTSTNLHPSLCTFTT